MRHFKPLLLLSCWFLIVSVQAAPPAARTLMREMQVKAAKERKNLMVIFHASWCGWCKKLDEFLNNSPEGRMVASSYIIVRLDVLENADKKSLENPGGIDLMKQWGGEKAGLPFMVILNPKSEKIIDSIRTGAPGGGNIGYPAAPEEIGYFGTMLEKSSKLTAEERARIAAWLKKNAPKSGQ